MQVNGPPQIVLFAIDFQEHLIQMPFVSRPATMALQYIGVGLTKFQAPLPNRFVGQHNAALYHELFDITETEREAKIQPVLATLIIRSKISSLSLFGDEHDAYHMPFLRTVVRSSHNKPAQHQDCLSVQQVREPFR